MQLNCQQVCDRLIDLLNEESDSEDIDVEMHLLECSDCQSEYDHLVHTMMLLHGLPEPIPPSDLVIRIRKRIEELSKKKSPIFDVISPLFSKVFVALKLGPRPVYLNYAALIFYLVVTLFLVKLVFLPSGREVQPPITPIATFSASVEYSQASHVPTSDSQRINGIWGAIKQAEPSSSSDLGKNPSGFKRMHPKTFHQPGGESRWGLSGGAWDGF